MLGFIHKSKKNPTIVEKPKRSARRQAFDLFDKGYRPSEIFKKRLIDADISMKTLLRYYEDWKKQKRQAVALVLNKYLDDKLGLSFWDIKVLANYFGISEDQIILRMQKPLGVLSLLYEELFDNRLRGIRKEIESRLDAALQLVYLAEKFYGNSPEQVNRFISEILTVEDNTRLVISKEEGRIAIDKERLKATS